MEPLQDLIITFHYVEMYEGRHRRHAHRISVRARSFGEAAQMADEYYKDLSRNSGTLFGRRLLSVQIDLRDAPTADGAICSELTEVDPPA
jgi:hypothetical protein